jgi:hypothetical protein
MVDPGKWPRLVVTGLDVTPEQADEIIIRTTDLGWLHSKDPEWNNAVEVAFGFENGRIGTAIERTRNLRLRWLVNKRIATSWIGGPHGWCDWNGAIGTNTYNLGKYPSVEDVDTEWRTIAAAFPYLELEAWLVADEGDGPVAAHWRLRGGSVEALPLTEAPSLPDEIDFRAMVYTGLQNAGQRAGVSLERLYAAIARVEGTRG